jgi:prepilin-type N-terminal cleavage/methylation domain-containing protein
MPIRVDRRRQRGFSLVELLIVVAIILILAAIAVPKLNQNRMFAQETAAIKQMQTIHSMETQYYSQYGKYATVLTELGPPASGQPGPTAADLIPKDLADGKRSGYIFQLQGSPTGYSINANPEAYNSTGRRSFFSDQTLVIRQNWGPEPATINSPELK